MLRLLLRRLPAFLLLLPILAACSGGAAPPPPTAAEGRNEPARLATVAPAAPVGDWYRAALEEGQVLVYADVSPGEAELLAELFSKRHPKVRIDWTRGLDRELLARVRAGEAPFDVFVGDAGTLLKSAGLAEHWSPPEAAALRPEYRDPEGAWHAVAGTYHVLQYHTEQAPAAHQLTRYRDLADLPLLGRIAAEEEALTWLKGVLESRGRQATLNGLVPVAAHGVVLQKGPQTLSHLVGAGRYAVAIDNRLDAVERDKRTGAKTDWVAIEPVVVQPTAVVLSARAPHPNAARLFANFLLTADAQHLLAAGGRVPSRRDVDPEPAPPVRALRTHFTLPPEGAAERDLRALYVDLWRPR